MAAATGPKVIQEALIAQLNTITVAAGFNTDLGGAGGGGAQKPGAVSNPLATLPVVVVSVTGESKAEPRSSHVHVSSELRFELDCVPDQTGASPEDQVHDLAQDIERIIYAEKAADPPLGVAGVDDIVAGGHVKLPVEGEALDGCLYEFTVRYRHDQADPRTFSA